LPFVVQHGQEEVNTKKESSFRSNVYISILKQSWLDSGLHRIGLDAWPPQGNNALRFAVRVKKKKRGDDTKGRAVTGPREFLFSFLCVAISRQEGIQLGIQLTSM
jgi:hypothetical protein